MRVQDLGGVCYPGARLSGYVAGSRTPAPLYRGADLTLTHSDTVIADGAGFLPAIFLDPAVRYRIVLESAGGEAIQRMTYDPVVVDSAGDVRLEAADPLAPLSFAGGQRGDTMSVLDFGAKGDGVADDTAAIQRALDAAGRLTVPDERFEGYGYVLKGGATVHLPAGQYRTGTTLTIPQNVSIVGDGKHSSVLRSSSREHVLRNAATSTRQGSYDRTGMALRDFGIIGDRDAERQVGIGLLRIVSARLENIHVSKCGSHGFELMQVVCSTFTGVESVRNVGHGLVIGQGKDDWERPLNALPSNANLFNSYRAVQNDGAGLHFKSGANGNIFINPVCEHNALASGDNAGFNVVSETDGYVPNTLYGLWTEGPVKAHVHVNNNDISTALEIVSWRHFADGVSGNVDRALVVTRGTVRLNSPTAPATSYRRINGSIAPFRLDDLGSAVLHITDPSGAQAQGIALVEGPRGLMTGLENNLRQRGPDVIYGPIRHFTANGAVAAGEWYTDTAQIHPYLRIEPFHRALAFGQGDAGPDVMLKRTAARVLGLDSRGGSQFFDHGSAWNGNHVLMGSYHLWVDASGTLRIKNGSPDSDTDGAEVGI